MRRDEPSWAKSRNRALVPPGLLGLLILLTLAGCCAGRPLRETLYEPSGGAPENTPSSSSEGPGIDLRGGLTEQKAVALALRRSPSLDALRQRIEAARFDIRIARMLPNPEFSVGDLRAGHLRSLFPDANDASAPFQGVDLGARWFFPYPAVRSARIRATRYRVEETEADLESATAGLVARVRLLHATLFSLDEELRAVADRVDLRGRQRDLTSRAVEQMTATVLDESAAQLAYLEALSDEERLRLTRRETLQELSALLRLPETDTLRVVATALPCSLAFRDEAAWVREAFAARADLRATRARYAQADAGVMEASGARIPWPSYLRISYELAGRQDPGGWEVGLGIPLPFLNRGTAKIRKLEAERATRQAEFEARKREIASEVRRTLGHLQASERVVALYRDQILPAVEQSLNQMRRAVEAGQADQKRLFAVEERALDEKLAYLKTLLNFQQALIELDRITGRDDRSRTGGDGE